MRKLSDKIKQLEEERKQMEEQIKVLTDERDNWKIAHADIKQELTKELHRMQEDIHHLRGAVREEGELSHMDELKEGLKKECIAELKEDMIQELDTKQGNWIEVVKKNIKKEVREERAKEEVTMVQDTLEEEKLRNARRLNVRITGLPEGASPDTDAQEFCRSLGYTTMPFTRVWRAGKDVTRSRALILQMQSQEDRVAFFRKRAILRGRPESDVQELRRPNVQQPLHAENGAENQPIGAENQPQEVAIDAPQVRGILAQLGYEKLDDVIGRIELLKPRDVSVLKTQHLDLNFLLTSVGLPKWSSTKIRKQEVHKNGPVLDDVLLADPEIADGIAEEKIVQKTVRIFNVDRAVCGRVAGAIAKKYGDTGFAGQLDIKFVGSAGQSFGCFLTPGMNIRLVGEANDYVGKGMAGGEIVIVPLENVGFCPEEKAVVEGTGDHCCEYMTGGCIVVLGKVGRNVGAGMTGGLAYLLDEDNSLLPKVNKEIVRMQRVTAPGGQQQLKSLIQAHMDKTGSAKAQEVLKNWDKFLPLFWQLVPPSEEDTPEASASYEPLQEVATVST
ncbi:hypothetical protein L7F22_015217 [Adiantum nelumboides]|nr:hypothetical protein [Adiantum nelumboides]